MLKTDSTKDSIALYRLGYAYAKLNQTVNAKQALSEAAEIEGPFRQAAKDLLDKLNHPVVRRK